MRKILVTAFAVSLVVATMLAPAAVAQGGQTAPANRQQGVRDANGDGICDVTGQPMGTGAKADNGKSWGPGDGSGNAGTGPKDGTGYGAQSGKRLGPQDGSGARQHRPTGSSGRGGRRG